MVEGFSDDYTRKSVKEDYNTYVFSKIGFEVTRIDFFEQKHASNGLLYVAADNPLLADGNKKERITSIIAERKKESKNPPAQEYEVLYCLYEMKL